MRKKIITLIFLFAFLIMIMSINTGISGLIMFINLPSLVLILFFTVPIMVFSDIIGDYICAIKVSLGIGEHTLKELKTAKSAIEVTIKFVFISAAIGAITGLVMLLGSLNDPSVIGPYLGVCILTILYACIINLVQLGIKSKIIKEIIYRE